MAALVQTIPSQQSTTVTMLQTRPSSASGMLQSSQAFSSTSHASQNSLQNLAGNLSQAVYRSSSSAPVAPYAFTSTPSLAKPSVPQRPEHRSTASAPSIPTLNSPEMLAQTRYTGQTSGPVTPSQENAPSISKDDASVSSTDKLPVINTTTTATLAPPASTTPTTKSSPDRYRRNANRRNESATSVTTVSNITTPTAAAPPAPASPEAGQRLSLHIPHFAKMTNASPDFQNGIPRATADDMQVGRQSSSDAAKRYRRRSIHTIEINDYNSGLDVSKGLQLETGRLGMSGYDKPHPLRSSPVVAVPPGSSHGRNGSSESVSSSRSTNSRPTSASKRDATTTAVSSENPTPANTASPADSSSYRVEQPKVVNIPPRNSSADAAKRITNPSPLSKTTMRAESPVVSKDSFASAVSAALQQSTKPTYAQVAQGRTVPQSNAAPTPAAAAPAAAVAPATATAPSPAAKHLAALNDKENKRKSSKLRRAFSFGSAAELRKASVQAQASRIEDPIEAEHERIAQQQEAGGIGRGIYSGQGGIFSGSTDNLSISSTASSASVMIRKMGRGMKKSTRSLVGLFRPKSIIGVPAADAAVPEISQAQVTMVNVEAERDKVNVNLDPHDRAGGGTGYPKLEQNSVDTDRLGSFSTDSSATRRSIVGGERERAEVLATIRKGILKHTNIMESGNNSPSIHPSENKSPNFGLPQIPHSTLNESPNSSTPSTPTDDAQGHRRTGSVALSGDDYFMSALKFTGDKGSIPGTPQSTSKRNATFSPRIQFHDTWPSAEYDRRGEIATCNRLTPMLAQQIKEELNTFKMEMEVHENSKIYTHFF